MSTNPEIQQIDTAPPPTKAQKKRSNIFQGTYLLLSLGCFALFFLLKLKIFEIFGSYRQLGLKLLIAGGISFILLFIAKRLEGLVGHHTDNKGARYNLIKLVHLLSVLLVVLVLISALFQNWYTAVVSLGLISLILGFALQTPITSFIGWLYLILRRPFSVGDRIQIADFKGDVVAIGYLDTTLWEFGGAYLSSDVPSGRLIRFPNSLVLSSPTFNYSWPRFPYIWNELPFHVAYGSDFDFVTETLRREATKILGPDMKKHLEELQEMVRSSEVDDLVIREYPFVTIRTNVNTWIECTLVYLVPPRQASTIRTGILKACIAALQQEPEKVMFPNGDNR